VDYFAERAAFHARLEALLVEGASPWADPAALAVHVAWMSDVVSVGKGYRGDRGVV
jgi:hypothetical protein